MGFNLLLAQRLCEWICRVVCGVDSFNLDVTFLEVIADEVVSALGVLGFLVRPRLLS